MKFRIMRKIGLIVLISLLICSCATLFNSRTENLTIITSEPSKIVVSHDTSNFYLTQQNLIVPRSKEPLNISTINPTSSKSISIKSKSSFAYWLNLYPSSAWTGFLIDMNNPKRYSYPRTIFINTRSKENSYLTYKPIDSTISKLNNIIKFTPLKLVGLSNSGIEVSFERKTGNYFSTQIMASYLLPSNFLDAYDYKPMYKGFRLGIEEKLYFKKSALYGPYLGLEFNYMKNQYKNISWFGVKNIYSDTTYNFTNYPDSIRIHKQTYSINLKLGYQYFVNRFSFDVYVGLGARYKDVVHLDRINPKDDMEMPRHPNFYYITNLNGKYWTLSIPLNFRIGWTF